MKVAYLAPELPALSATFVYNEILQLEKLGTEVVPFSVHKPNSKVQEARVCDLEDRTVNLYAQAKLLVLKGHVLLFASHPVRYLKTLWLLCQDMCSVGFFTRTSFGLGYRFLFSASLATHLIKEECDHLHVHFAHIPTDIAMYASSLSSIPFSVTAHANDIFERGWLLKEKVDRSSFFATISEFNKKYLADIGVKTDKVEIVRCGVDPDQFSPKKAVANNQVIKIGVIGRLVEKKGIDILIEAVTALKAQGKRIELHIAGSGPLEDSLKSLVRRNKLSEKEVVFFGAIPHAEVAGFIKSLDMFVLPCRQGKNGDIDGIPVVLMEAMISGVPVITSNLSGIPELVIDQVTGLLHEENNIEALAEKISLLSEDTVLRQVLINEGSTKVKKDFSLIDNTKKLNFLFLNEDFAFYNK